MNQEDREKKLRAVQKAKGSFVVAPAPAGKFKLAKRLGRKLTFWYVQPFGGKQNVYNDAAADMLAALNEAPDAAPEELLKNVRKGVDSFVKEAEQFDDLTMLCLKYNGPAAPEGKEGETT